MIDRKNWWKGGWMGVGGGLGLVVGVWWMR